MTTPADATSVDTAITSRRSIRGYLPQPVPEAVVRDILAVASRAPSMTNSQPWLVHVVTGAARDRLSADIQAEHASGTPAKGEYPYYPREWHSPYLDRRRQVGWALYGLLGISKGDREATARQHRRNFDFFGAPVGLIFSMHQDMQAGSFLDLGMFLQNIMVAARARGLDTCAQAAFMDYHAIIRRQLGIPAEHIVVCGMALGHADPAEPANALVSPREAVESFTTFLSE